MIDYHSHSVMCGHGEGEPCEYAGQAAKLGLKEFGCSEHIPLEVWTEPNPHLSMGVEQFEDYLERVDFAAWKQKSALKVRVGIEADYYAGKETEIGTFLKKYEFDYVIGSIHKIGDWMVDGKEQAEEYEKRDINEVYISYFYELEKMCRTGMYDIVGHADLIKIFGHRPTINMDGVYESFTRVLAETGMAIELNTAGWRKPVGEQYPEKRLIEFCKIQKVDFVLGGDAHKPEDVAYRFKEAIEILKECGVNSLITFQKRRKKDIVIL